MDALADIKCGWNRVVHAMSDSPEVAFVPVDEACGEIGTPGEEFQRPVDIVVKVIGQGALLFQPGEGPYAEDINCQHGQDPNGRLQGDGEAMRLGGRWCHAVMLASVGGEGYWDVCGWSAVC